MKVCSYVPKKFLLITGVLATLIHTCVKMATCVSVVFKFKSFANIHSLVPKKICPGRICNIMVSSFRTV
jgi:hypothetical protein